MGLFDIFGGQTQQAPQQRPQMDPRQMQQEVGQIKADPGSYLKARGYNIPDGMTDAKQITQHLLRTGQVGIPRLQQTASLFGWNPGRR